MKYVKGILVIALIGFSLKSIAQVGVCISEGVQSPDQAAMLDVVSADKGILIPRLDLDDVNDGQYPVPNVIEGVMIYNETGDVSAGYNYWDGGEWSPLGGDGLWLDDGSGNPYLEKDDYRVRTSGVYALYAESFKVSNSLNIGVYGEAKGGTSANYGVNGVARHSVANPNSFDVGVFGADLSTSPNSLAGYFSGDVQVTGNLNVSGVITSISDESLKMNIQPMNNGLNIISQLSPKTYDFRTTEYPFMNLPEGNRCGLIAQEVELFLPRLVSTTSFPAQYDETDNETVPSSTYKGLNYVEFVPILIQGIKEQQVLIEALQTQNAQLEQRIEVLEN